MSESVKRSKSGWGFPIGQTSRWGSAAPAGTTSEPTDSLVAVMGLVGLLFVDHGPRNKPDVKNETMIQYGTTAASAAAAGATVTPTEKKPQLGPAAPARNPSSPRSLANRNPSC
jgi:hypothetical protein